MNNQFEASVSPYTTTIMGQRVATLCNTEHIRIATGLQSCCNVIKWDVV